MKEIKDAIPNRRVLLVFAGMVLGFATNAWHKNVVSGALALICLIAFSAWVGGKLLQGGE